MGEKVRNLAVRMVLVKKDLECERLREWKRSGADVLVQAVRAFGGLERLVLVHGDEKGKKVERRCDCIGALLLLQEYLKEILEEDEESREDLECEVVLGKGRRWRLPAMGCAAEEKVLRWVAEEKGRWNFLLKE